MKVDCINGFYKFTPDNVGEMRIWQDYNGIELANCGDFMTFEHLAKMPNYSFINGTIDNNQLIVNYAGEKSEVLKRNNLVYDWEKDIIVPKNSITASLNVDRDIFINAAKLPQAGAINGLVRMVGFSGFWNMSYNMYKIERFEYESISSGN